MEQINNESDSDVEDTTYRLRSKRRRISLDLDEPTCSYDIPSSSTSRRRKNPLLHMPTEVLQKILSFVPFTELSDSVRLVNHRLKIIAEDTLNRGFRKLEDRLKALMNSTIDSIQSTQDDLEIRSLCKLLNMVEVLLFQQSVIMATIWRYVYNTYYKTYRCCMYGGKLLDVHESFIWKFVHIPHQLYAPSLFKDYTMPEEVNNIVELTKQFCLHFEKVTEEPINNDLFHSGSKVLDILNCAIYTHKNIIFERSNSKVFSAKYCFFISNAWFVALDISSDKELSWSQKQRLMHMRLRRIVLAHTEMLMSQNQFERERILRTDLSVPPKKPGNSVYTGYGDVLDTFFYYGVMNDGAYLQKFHVEALDVDDDIDDDDEALDFQDVDPNAGNPMAAGADDNDSSVMYRIPHLGVRIDVSLKCPLTHAPLNFLQSRESLTATVLDDEQGCSSACVSPGRQSACASPGRQSGSDSPSNLATASPDRTHQKFHLKLGFECYGASYPRLPTKYMYNAKHVRK